MATLGILLLAGGTELAGLGLYEDRKAHPAGLLIALSAPVWFLVVTVYVWRGFEREGGWAATALLFLTVSAVMIATGRPLTGDVVIESSSGALVVRDVSGAVVLHPRELLALRKR